MTNDRNADDKGLSAAQAGSAENRSGSDADEPRLLWVLSVPRAFEERVVDWLLEHDLIERFSSSVIDLHGAPQAELRGAEKVSGRQRRTQFQVHVLARRLDVLVATLTEEFAGQDIAWFALPEVAHGSLR